MTPAADRDHSKRARGAQRGFSLLEAMAAVALIAVAFLPFLALQSRLSETALAIDRAERIVVAKKSALAFLRVINPAARPQGSEQAGEAILTWNASPAGPERPALDSGGGENRFVVQIYRIDARLVFVDGQESRFTVDALGWRTVRPAGEAL